MWIEVFRRGRALDLESAVGGLDEVVTCLPVIQEVLQGFRDENAFRVARDSMNAFPIVESPLGEDVFDDAIKLFRQARRAGITVRSSVDCLIAACAIDHRLPILHIDGDYGALARVSTLEARQVR